MQTTTKAIEWTKEQNAIFHAMALGNSNLVIEAVAGSGKTETVLQGVYKMPAYKTHKPILVGSFMKRNQLDAARRIKPEAQHVEAATWNSVGLRFVKQNAPRIRVNFGAEWGRIKTAEPSLVEKAAYLAWQLSRAIEFAKGMQIGVPNEAEMNKFFDFVGVNINDKDAGTWTLEKLNEMARTIMQQALDAPVECSGADMNWLAVSKGWIRPSYAAIIADEYQDINVLQDAMLNSLLLPGGTVTCVGDTFQSLYSWRGSVENAMTFAAQKYTAKRLGLTNSFRCPHVVSPLAQQYVPHFQAHSGNIQGTLKNALGDDMIAQAQTGDVILSRTKAPLMHFALKLIRANKPAKIEGKELGNELRVTIENIADGSDDIASFGDKLNVWENVSLSKVNPQSFTAAERAANIQDMAATIRCLSETVSSVKQMTGKLYSLFQNSDDAGNRPVVLLSTVHKAKGLEWPNVFQLVETFGKARATATERQLQEERNIAYVAVTRARNTLTRVREK